MSLTFLTGPFATGSGQFDFGQLREHVRYWEPWPRRMRAVIAGEMVLDSRRGLLLCETATFPVHYFPLEDFSQELLVLPDSQEVRDERRWGLKVADTLIDDCVTRHPG